MLFSISCLDAGLPDAVVDCIAGLNDANVALCSHGLILRLTKINSLLDEFENFKVNFTDKRIMINHKYL